MSSQTKYLAVIGIVIYFCGVICGMGFHNKYATLVNFIIAIIMYFLGMLANRKVLNGGTS